MQNCGTALRSAHQQVFLFSLEMIAWCSASAIRARSTHTKNTLGFSRTNSRTESETGERKRVMHAVPGV